LGVLGPVLVVKKTDPAEQRTAVALLDCPVSEASLLALALEALDPRPGLLPTQRPQQHVAHDLRVCGDSGEGVEVVLGPRAQSEIIRLDDRGHTSTETAQVLRLHPG